MQRFRDLFGDTSNTTLSIVVMGLLLLFIIVLPRVIPGGRFGVSCKSVANPIAGGNNQSLLADRSEGALQLNISLQHSSLAVGDPLAVNATFVNSGVGAITLFFIPEEALLRDDGTSGLSFQITRLSDLTPFSEPTNVRPPNPQRTTFPVEVLHVLGAKQRCTEQLTFDSIRLNSLGLSPGRYSIRAIYRNLFPGDLNTAPNAIATPIFPDQGVYVVQELRSNEVEFTIGIASQSGEAPPLGG